MLFNPTLITLIFISAEFLAVGCIVIITKKLTSSIQTDDFKYITYAWWANLLYVFLQVTEKYNQLNNQNDYSVFFDQLTIVIDSFQFGLLLFALSKTKHEYTGKKPIEKLGYGWIILSVAIFINAIYWKYWNSEISFIFSNYVNYYYLPVALFNAIALFLTANFFRSIFQTYRVSHKAIFYGCRMYSFIQLLIIFKYELRIVSYIELAGWFLGLFSKCLIGWGLLSIFKAEASRSRRLEKILGQIFHELRNTLFGIDVPVKRILYGKDTKPKNEAQEIEKTYEIMASIIDGAQIAFKNELDKVQVDDEGDLLNIQSLITQHMQNTRLNSLVEIAIKISRSITLNKVKYHVDYGGGGCVISCFKHEVIQILVNILKNAYEAFPNGVGNIYIITRNKLIESQEQKVVNIEIIDDGPGIPDENHTKIFEYGFSTKETGSGIGLNLIRELIDKNYGEIFVESPVINHNEIEEGGAKFRILFTKNKASVNGKV